MKKIVLSLIAIFCGVFILQAAKEKPNCKITITVEDGTEGKLIMRTMMQNKLDTLSYTKAKLVKDYVLTEVTPIYVADLDGHYQIFFADPNSNINLTIKIGSGLTVTFLEGSKSNEVFRSLISKQEPIQKFSQQLTQAFQKPEANKDSINTVLQYLNGELRKNFFNFLQENSTSEVASYVAYNSVMNERSLNYKMADTMYQFLQGNARNGFYGKEFNKTLNKLKSVEVGNIAPDFTLPDSTEKKMYTLRKVKAEYILLDLWASWCGPCKAEIPSMKKAYEKYHSQGFEIVSVSIDQKKDAWKAALQQFQMPWIHLLETDRVISDLYHFPTIPKTILMDKTGKILAADLRGDALELKLNELYKNK